MLRLSADTLQVRLRAIARTRKRDIHGPTLYVTGSANAFAAAPPRRRIDIPCSAEEYTLAGFELDLELLPGGAVDANAAVLFALVARHCLDDVGGQGMHPLGMAVAPLRDLLRGGVVDVPFTEYLAKVEKSFEHGGPIARADALLRREGLGGVQERGRLVLRGVRAELPRGRALARPGALSFLVSADAHKRVQDATRAYIERSSLPFRTLEPADARWRWFFVPVYTTETGMKLPSGALPSMVYTAPPAEAFLERMALCELVHHGWDPPAFAAVCEEAVALYARWAAGAPAEPTEEHHRCVQVAARICASLANAIAYKTDVFELPDGTEVVCERLTTQLDHRQADDCEDGSGSNVRVCYEFQRRAAAAASPLVRALGALLDLYVPAINRMHCGECHILSVLVLRDRMRAMMAGAWDAAAEEAVYWPDYMYEGGRRPPTPRARHAADWPLPPVLYMEPTRVSVPNQVPYSHRPAGDELALVEHRVEHTRRLLERYPLLRRWSPMTTYAAADPAGMAGHWYQGHVYGSLMAPQLVRALRGGAPDGGGFMDFYYLDGAGRYGVTHAAFCTADAAVRAVPYAHFGADYVRALAAVIRADPPVVGQRASGAAELREHPDFDRDGALAALMAARRRPGATLARVYLYPQEQQVDVAYLEGLARADASIVDMHVWQWDVCDVPLPGAPLAEAHRALAAELGVDLASAPALYAWARESHMREQLERRGVAHTEAHACLRHALYSAALARPLTRTQVEIVLSV